MIWTVFRAVKTHQGVKDFVPQFHSNQLRSNNTYLAYILSSMLEQLSLPLCNSSIDSVSRSSACYYHFWNLRCPRHQYCQYRQHRQCLQYHHRCQYSHYCQYLIWRKEETNIHHMAIGNEPQYQISLTTSCQMLRHLSPTACMKLKGTFRLKVQRYV